MAKKNEYVTDILELEQFVGENAAQFSMAREITIPGEVKKIKEVENEITDITTEILEDKVVVEGYLDQKITYLDDQGTEKQENFNEIFVNHVSFPGISAEMTVQVFSRIESVEHVELSKEREKTVFNQTIVVEIMVMCCKKIEEEIIMEVPGADPKKIKKTDLIINRFVGAAKEVTSLTSEAILNEPIARVNSVTAEFEDLSYEVVEDKVFIKGNLIKKINYLEEVSSSQAEESLKDSFEHSIRIAGAAPGMEVKVYPRVEKFVHQINPQERNKVKQTVFINFIARIDEKVSMEVVAGMEDDADTARGFLNLYNNIGEASEELSLVNEFELSLPVRKIISPVETNITSMNADLVDDALEVSGTLKTRLIYVSDETGNIEEEISDEYFKHKLNISGTQEGMLYYMYPRVEYSNFKIMDDMKRVRQTTLIKFSIKVVDREEQEFLSVEKKEKEDNEAKPQILGTTIVVYVVQEEESIYSIAQKFNVSIDSILKTNKLEDPDLISSGQKLLISCYGQ